MKWLSLFIPPFHVRSVCWSCYPFACPFGLLIMLFNSQIQTLLPCKMCIIVYLVTFILLLSSPSFSNSNQVEEQSEISKRLQVQSSRPAERGLFRMLSGKGTCTSDGTSCDKSSTCSSCCNTATTWYSTSNAVTTSYTACGKFLVLSRTRYN